MTTPSKSTSTGDAPLPRRRRRRGMALLAAAAVTLGLGWLGWQYFAPAPPLPDLTNCDPEVTNAIEAARANVRLWPWSAERWGQLGILLLAHDMNAEALTCLAHAEEYDPADMRWPYYQGLIFLMDNPEAALP